MSAIRRVAGALLAAAALAAQPLQAQTVNVGAIVSERACSIYEDFWGMWLVVECRNNFAALRARLQSALAETGRVRPASGEGRGGRYQLTGQVTELGVASASAADADYASESNRAVGHLDVQLRDGANGRVVFGATIIRSVDLSSAQAAGGMITASAQSPHAIYDAMQRELALGAARAIAFHFDPLRVTSVDGREVQLNYGTPLLTLGTIVLVPDAGGRPIRYQVTGALPQSAVAEVMGDLGQIAPGTIASVVDRDDPAANGRRFRRVDLPGN
ncbi:MAG: hypothetical protein JO276_11670 [Sphingomonadaceae bacterium]|nr:hypothetical protein [Sphingomonadaceae bacterium]